MSLRRRILLSPGSNGQDLSPPPSHQVPSHVIIAVAATAAASLFLALIYYAVLRHHRRRPLSHLTHASSSSSSSSSSSDPSDHPIWHVKTVGLDDAAIASIGSYAHCSPAADCSCSCSCSCSVCLGEVLDGDTVRLLPKCGHVFHVQCIDTWLRCHVSCPLCRAAVVDPCPTAPATTDGAGDVEESSVESNPTQSDEGAGQEGEGESEARVRVSVEIPPESSGALKSISMDLEKDQEGSELEKGRSESGRSFLFSRLGRARSSSVLPL